MYHAEQKDTQFKRVFVCVRAEVPYGTKERVLTGTCACVIEVLFDDDDISRAHEKNF